MVANFKQMYGRSQEESFESVMKRKKALLTLEPYHMSVSKAEDHVKRLLRQFNVKKPPKGWHSTTYSLNAGKGDITLVWSEMVNEVRENGSVSSIERLLDISDPIFGGTFGMAISGPSMDISTSFLGQTKKFKGPARTYPVEQELADDIHAYRRLCCESSVPGDFSETSRFFRSYLFSCISLVEAFINRHVHIAKYKGFESEYIEQLERPARIDQRLSYWLKAFGKRGDSELKNGVAWNHFIELKNVRNLHVHAVEPYFGYQIDRMVKPLNACREGVGGLILFLQREAGFKPISLFNRIKTAPVVKFSSDRG